MLSPSQIRAIHALSAVDRKKRHLELTNKVASLVILTPDELQEQTVLRELLQGDAETARFSTDGKPS